jgi:hypothetical protein
MRVTVLAALLLLTGCGPARRNPAHAVVDPCPSTLLRVWLDRGLIISDGHVVSNLDSLRASLARKVITEVDSTRGGHGSRYVLLLITRDPRPADAAPAVCRDL